MSSAMARAAAAATRSDSEAFDQMQLDPSALIGVAAPSRLKEIFSEAASLINPSTVVSAYERAINAAQNEYFAGSDSPELTACNILLLSGARHVLATYAAQDGLKAWSQQLRTYATVPIAPGASQDQGGALLFQISELLKQHRTTPVAGVLATALLQQYHARCERYLVEHGYIDAAHTHLHDFLDKLGAFIAKLVHRTRSVADLMGETDANFSNFVARLTQASLQPAVHTLNVVGDNQLGVVARVRSEQFESIAMQAPLNRASTFYRLASAGVASPPSPLSSRDAALLSLALNIEEAITTKLTGTRRELKPELADKTPVEAVFHVEREFMRLAVTPDTPQHYATLLRLFTTLWLPLRCGFGWNALLHQFDIEAVLGTLLTTNASGARVDNVLLPLVGAPFFAYHPALRSGAQPCNIQTVSLLTELYAFYAYFVRNDATVWPLSHSNNDESSSSKLSGGAATLSKLSSAAAQQWFDALVSARPSTALSLHDDEVARVSAHQPFLYARQLAVVLDATQHPFPWMERESVESDAHVPATRRFTELMPRHVFAPADRTYELALRLYTFAAAQVGAPRIGLGVDNSQRGAIVAELGVDAPRQLARFIELQRDAAGRTLIAFVGYALARAACVLAYMHPNVVCVCVSVEDQHSSTLSTYNHTVRIRDYMAIHYDRSLRERVSFVENGSLFDFHRRGPEFYRELRVRYDRALRAQGVAVETPPERVVIVANHYHAFFAHDIPRMLFLHWMSTLLHILAGDANTRQTRARLMVISTAATSAFGGYDSPTMSDEPELLPLHNDDGAPDDASDLMRDVDNLGLYRRSDVLTSESFFPENLPVGTAGFPAVVHLYRHVDWPHAPLHQPVSLLLLWNAPTMQRRNAIMLALQTRDNTARDNGALDNSSELKLRATAMQDTIRSLLQIQITDYAPTLPLVFEHLVAHVANLLFTCKAIAMLPGADSVQSARKTLQETRDDLQRKEAQNSDHAVLVDIANAIDDFIATKLAPPSPPLSSSPPPPPPSPKSPPAEAKQSPPPPSQPKPAAPKKAAPAAASSPAPAASKKAAASSPSTRSVRGIDADFMQRQLEKISHTLPAAAAKPDATCLEAVGEFTSTLLEFVDASLSQYDRDFINGTPDLSALYTLHDRYTAAHQRVAACLCALATQVEAPAAHARMDADVPVLDSLVTALSYAQMITAAFSAATSLLQSATSDRSRTHRDFVEREDRFIREAALACGMSMSDASRLQDLLFALSDWLVPFMSTKLGGAGENMLGLPTTGAVLWNDLKTHITTTETRERITALRKGAISDYALEHPDEFSEESQNGGGAGGDDSASNEEVVSGGDDGGAGDEDDDEMDEDAPDVSVDDRAAEAHGLKIVQQFYTSAESVIQQLPNAVYPTPPLRFMATDALIARGEATRGERELLRRLHRAFIRIDVALPAATSNTLDRHLEALVGALQIAARTFMMHGLDRTVEAVESLAQRIEARTESVESIVSGDRTSMLSTALSMRYAYTLSLSEGASTMALLGVAPEALSSGKVETLAALCANAYYVPSAETPHTSGSDAIAVERQTQAQVVFVPSGLRGHLSSAQIDFAKRVNDASLRAWLESTRVSALANAQLQQQGAIDVVLLSELLVLLLDDKDAVRFGDWRDSAAQMRFVERVTPAVFDRMVVRDLRELVDKLLGARALGIVYAVVGEGVAGAGSGVEALRNTLEKLQHAYASAADNSDNYRALQLCVTALCQLRLLRFAANASGKLKKQADVARLRQWWANYKRALESFGEHGSKRIRGAATMVSVPDAMPLPSDSDGWRDVPMNQSWLIVSTLFSLWNGLAEESANDSDDEFRQRVARRLESDAVANDTARAVHNEIDSIKQDRTKEAQNVAIDALVKRLRIKTDAARSLLAGKDDQIAKTLADIMASQQYQSRFQAWLNNAQLLAHDMYRAWHVALQRLCTVLQSSPNAVGSYIMLRMPSWHVRLAHMAVSSFGRGLGMAVYETALRRLDTRLRAILTGSEPEHEGTRSIMQWTNKKQTALNAMRKKRVEFKLAKPDDAATQLSLSVRDALASVVAAIPLSATATYAEASRFASAVLAAVQPQNQLELRIAALHKRSGTTAAPATTKTPAKRKRGKETPNEQAGEAGASSSPKGGKGKSAATKRGADIMGKISTPYAAIPLIRSTRVDAPIDYATNEMLGRVQAVLRAFSVPDSDALAFLYVGMLRYLEVVSIRGVQFAAYAAEDMFPEDQPSTVSSIEAFVDSFLEVLTSMSLFYGNTMYLLDASDNEAYLRAAGDDPLRQDVEVDEDESEPSDENSDENDDDNGDE